MMQVPQYKPTIYVAEDDADDREILMEAFQFVTDRYHLTVVSSGKALIEMLSGKSESELPCLIVLDYNMPELNGKQVLEYCKIQCDTVEFQKSYIRLLIPRWKNQNFYPWE